MSLQPLFDHFESYLPFDEREKRVLESRVSPRRFRRRQAILQEGFPCQHHSFVVEGCLRLFGVDADVGTEGIFTDLIIRND